MRNAVIRASLFLGVLFVLFVLFGGSLTLAAMDAASGTVSYKTRSGEYTITITSAYLVKGPDVVDPTVNVARLIFSTTDIGAAIEKCASMICVDSQVKEGMVVEISDGPRLSFWLTLKEGTVQYSGTHGPEALTITADSPTKLSGKLVFDASSTGGPKVDLTFDAGLIKEFKRGQ